MVINDKSKLTYIEPLKKMFPKGSYWDKLLSDENSDLSLICKARAESLATFRSRINQLQIESYPDSAEETIEDWERIYFGYENRGLTLIQRKNLLKVQQSGVININVIKMIAKTYDGEVHKWEIPYKPAIFGHTQFGLNYMASVAGFCVVFIHASVEKENRASFESSVKKTMLANQRIFFIYN